MSGVIYKGKKFNVFITYQYYGAKRTPLKCIQLRDMGINSIDELEGLLELKDLQHLDLSGNNISELNGLGELTNLQVLMVGNRTSEIRDLENLINLTHLALGNDLSKIENLNNFVNLTHLTLGGGISEIENLDKLINLTSLDLGNNKITEIQGLDNLRNLERLNLRGNQISEIKGLESLKRLFYLDLSANNISEINGLNKLKNLGSLDLSGNNIMEIKNLDNLLKLWNLDLSYNKITEINGLGKLINLQELNLSSNQIKVIKGFDNLHGTIIDLYSNPIPEAEMMRFRGYINGNFIFLSQIYDNQIITLFNNSHEKIKNKKYKFSLNYRNVDGNPPNDYGIKIHLINPEGKALEPFQMELFPLNYENPEYNSEKGVVFHYIIDLDTLQETEGLWHYYLTIKDKLNNKIIFIPEIGYILGPETTSPKTGYLLCIPSISTTSGEGYINSGFKNNNFTFTISCDQTILQGLFLCLIPAQKKVGVGVTNRIGIKKFPMRHIRSNSCGEWEYQCSINFEDLGYLDSELGWFSHYYEGILADRRRMYLYTEKVFCSEHERIDFSEKIIEMDIHKPFVASNKPQLIDYLFEDSEHSIYSHDIYSNDSSEILDNQLKTIYEIKSDLLLKYEVLYSDPSKSAPCEGYPRVIFKNLDTEKKFGYIMVPSDVVSIFSQRYSENFQSYICVINSSEFSEGTWEFCFEAKDSEGTLLKTLLGKEKFIKM
ncbi:MAG: leucine-rich repeat domain-containing protein [Candidatus Hodarchaeota archaeon]